jgi:hypothetical protein
MTGEASAISLRVSQEGSRHAALPDLARLTYARICPILCAMELTLQLDLVSIPTQHTAVLAMMRACHAVISQTTPGSSMDDVWIRFSVHRRCDRELRDHSSQGGLVT